MTMTILFSFLALNVILLALNNVACIYCSISIPSQSHKSYVCLGEKDNKVVNYYRFPLNNSMAQPTATGVTHPASVIGPSYCAPHPVDLAIITKTLTLTVGNFDVIDIQGNIVFKVRAVPFTCFQRARSVLLDAAGNHLVTLRPKVRYLLLNIVFLFTFSFMCVGIGKS
jgi:hypothetical protein